jgi:Hydrazine synthase alpha subunit middle domain
VYRNRQARFLRIIKAVSQPDDDTLDFNTDAFGVAGAQMMKEILGYVPIEPDGSAMFKVPSDVAFAIEIVNANMQRISPRHQMWLQVTTGEVLVCNGCHTQASEVPHGRVDAEPPSINTGAPTTGVPFPNTNQAMFAEQGETMAETYARTNNNGPRTPNFNIVYTDQWTDRTNGGLTPDPDLNLLYSDPANLIGLATTPPVSRGCQSSWGSDCRVIINYLQHIQPIWDLPSRLNDLGAAAACVSCHNKVGLDAMMSPIPQVPAGQLELTNEPIGALNQNPNQEMLWVMSYLDIFVDDYELELDAMGNLQRRTNQQQTGVDVDGNPIFQDVPIVVPSPISSGNFLQVFGPGGTHNGGITRLTPGELKLITEWLNIGAQYYNNPFDAPLN